MRKGNNNKRQQGKNKFATQTCVLYKRKCTLYHRGKEEKKSTHTHTLHQGAQTSDRALKIVPIQISLRLNQLQLWPRLGFRLRTRFKRDHSLNTTTLRPPTIPRACGAHLRYAPREAIVPIRRRTRHHALLPARRRRREWYRGRWRYCWCARFFPVLATLSAVA